MTDHVRALGGMLYLAAFSQRFHAPIIFKPYVMCASGSLMVKPANGCNSRTQPIHDRQTCVLEGFYMKAFLDIQDRSDEGYETF